MLTPIADAPEPIKVIVAEDEVLVRLMLADGLRHAGFHVLEAVDSADVITILQSIGADVVVTDLKMAKAEDGLAVARYARQNHPGTPVLLTSAMAPPVGAPFDAFFVKPYALEEVAAWIKRHVEARAPRTKDLSA